MALQEFEFLTDDSSFVPVLKSMLHYIEQQVSLPLAEAEQVLFQAKAVLTELLTNAIKHSGAALTLFVIEINGTVLCITKTDTAKPIGLVSHPALTSAGAMLQLSSDAMHTLLVTVAGKHMLYFTCTEPPVSQTPDIAHLGEHFGLLIITKIAHQFYYQFDEAECTNRFIVEILLDADQ